MLSDCCHSGLDPESPSATLYFGMLNQVQHDGVKAYHTAAPFLYCLQFL